MERDRIQQLERERKAQLEHERKLQLERERELTASRERASQLEREREAAVAREREAAIARERDAAAAREREALAAKERELQVLRELNRKTCLNRMLLLTSFTFRVAYLISCSSLPAVLGRPLHFQCQRCPLLRPHIGPQAAACQGQGISTCLTRSCLSIT